MDKRERNFRTGVIQNLGVIWVSVIALPVYFVRSRGWKRGLLAILAGFGVVLLVAGAVLCGRKGRRCDPPPTYRLMKIEIDDLRGPEIHALLEEHLRNMYERVPAPESVHALDLDKLRKPEITFWCAWEGPLLLGCGALKEIDPTHRRGEVDAHPGRAAPQGRGPRDPRAHHRRRAVPFLRAPEPRDGIHGGVRAGAQALRERRVHLLRAVRGLPTKTRTARSWTMRL
jgi:hypothetical protein